MWTQTWRIQKGTVNLLLRQVRGSKFCVGQHLPSLQYTYDKSGLELPLLSNLSQIKLNQYVFPLWAFASLCSSVLLCILPIAPSITWEKLPGRSWHPLFLVIPAQNWYLCGIVIILAVSCEGDSVLTEKCTYYSMSSTPHPNMLVSSLIFYFMPSVCELSFGKRRKKCCYCMCSLCSTVEFPSMIPSRFIINIVNYHHPSANPRRSNRGEKITLDWCAAQKLTSATSTNCGGEGCMQVLLGTQQLRHLCVSSRN